MLTRVNAYNFAGSGHNLTKFYQVMWLVAGVIMWTLILEGVPSTKFGMAKNVQNSARFLTTFDFDREYLRNGRRNENQKTALSSYQLQTLTYVRKNLVNFDPLTKKLQASRLTNLSGLFQETRPTFRPLGVLAPQIFTGSIHQSLLAHITIGSGSPNKF